MTVPEWMSYTDFQLPNARPLWKFQHYWPMVTPLKTHWKTQLLHCGFHTVFFIFFSQTSFSLSDFRILHASSHDLSSGSSAGLSGYNTYSDCLDSRLDTNVVPVQNKRLYVLYYKSHLIQTENTASWSTKAPIYPILSTSLVRVMRWECTSEGNRLAFTASSKW